MLPPPSGALAGQGNNECIKPLSFIMTAPIRNTPDMPGRQEIRLSSRHSGKMHIT
ncbi:hypothetical protein [Novacetimonas maltaceti]|uniref:hypothetical protein n=1 Tax=Novacetimonas maltaceti TaxID=1203393 RepID=UPI0015E17711|nr:hypothetical protein [Novacetimonas maltaceti]